MVVDMRRSNGQERRLRGAVKKLYYLDDTVETDFVLKGLARGRLYRFLDRIRALSHAALTKFADTDLNEMTAYETNGKHYESSLRWILHHVTEHEAGHQRADRDDETADPRREL